MNISSLLPKWLIKHRYWLTFAIFMTLGLLLTVYVEYFFIYQQNKWMGMRVLFISIAAFAYGGLPQLTRDKYKPVLLKLLGIVGVFFVLNLLLHLVNIYHLDRFTLISTLCATSPSICQGAEKVFFGLKIYRFVSLTPYFFMYLIFSLLSLVFSEKIYRGVTSLVGLNKKVKFKFKFSFVFYLLVTYMVLSQLILAFSIMTQNTVKMVGAMNQPFSQRWESAMGGRFSFGWMAPFGEFIKNTVAEDEVLLIPKQIPPWEMEGNPHYLRWFVYPITLVQIPEDSSDVPDNVDYILLTYGVFGIPKQTFPNFSIPEEKIDKIIVVNRETLEVTTLEATDFNPQNFENQWGLIKLKHNQDSSSVSGT